LPLEGPSRFVIARGTAISSLMLSNGLQAVAWRIAGP
jgi:hypothetical protein